MEKKTELAPAIRLIEDTAGAMTDMALMGQQMALGMLRAEMVALTTMMPGRGNIAEDEARQGADEAEIEAGFDNMPV